MPESKYVSHEKCSELREADIVSVDRRLSRKTPLWAFIGVCSLVVILFVSLVTYAHGIDKEVTAHIAAARVVTDTLKRDLGEVKVLLADQNKKLQIMSETLIRMEKNGRNNSP